MKVWRGTRTELQSLHLIPLAEYDLLDVVGSGFSILRVIDPSDGRLKSLTVRCDDCVFIEESSEGV